MNIILTGSLAIDRIMSFPGTFGEHILADKIHQLNVSFNIDSLEEKKGGTAANIAYSLALLGEQPRIVASAGSDFGAYREYLAALGVDVSGIEMQADVTTAACYITTDQDDNQITAFHMGAMAVETSMRVADLEEGSMVVLSPGNKGDMLRYSQECREQGVPFVFDPGQTLPFLEPDEIRAIMKGASFLFVNDYELEMILQRCEMTQEEVIAQVDALVVTLGGEGARLHADADVVEVNACEVSKVKDPTGAGDAFRAGFLRGLSAGHELQVCAQLGATAAVYAVEQLGTQEHSYTMDEFAARYSENYEADCPL